MIGQFYAIVTILLASCCGFYVSSAGAAENAPSNAIGMATQAWNMMPGESLNSLAALIYPDNPHMQQRFVSVTLDLNRSKLGGRTPGQRFDAMTAIMIPDLRYLSWDGARPAFYRSGQTATPRPAGVRHSMDHIHISSDRSGDALARAYWAQKRSAEPAPVVNQVAAQESGHHALESESPVRAAPRRVMAPAGKLPAEPLAAALAAALLLAGWLFARRNKLGKRTRVRRVVEPLPVPEEDESAASGYLAPKVNVVEVAPAATMRQHPDWVALQADAGISVDEIDSVVEEARLIVSMGRTGNAIKLLEEYVESNPRVSAQPWLYLLDLYRMTGQRREFAEFGKRMHQALNVMIPSWDSRASVPAVPVSLENFPHITQQLVKNWGTTACRDYLNSLARDNRAGERVGFSVRVVEEIQLLLSVIDARDGVPG